MADMDLDDLDGLSEAPTRAPRFEPKSKFKPKRKAEPQPESKPQALDASVSKKKGTEEELFQPLTKATVKQAEEPLPPSDANGSAKFECQSESYELNGAVKMEVEAKVEEEELNANAMEDSDGEDRVVREIDVFFNNPPIDDNTKLYVLQYPLRPCWRPYELDERCEEVRVKPGSAEVQVDLCVDVDSKNYDTEARGVRMTKQTLSSSWKPTRTNGYAVGILMGNKLHLNPIHAVVQLRPSMEHLKHGCSKKKDNEISDVQVKSEKPNDGESLGPPKKQGKVKGVLKQQNSDVEESWVPLKYHGSKSDFSANYLQKMIAQESTSIPFSMSPYDYVNSLCPGSCSNRVRPKGPSKRLLSLPLEERFRIWLREGPPVHRFNALKHLAPDDSVEDVLKVLRRLAQLVQGLWVPKSSLLFEGGQGLDVLARDYVLLLFSKNPVIKSSQVEVPKLNQYLKAILNILAIGRPSFKDWKFKEPTDVSFIKLYPDIVREQEQIWAGLEKSITSIIHGGRSGPGMRNSMKSNMPSKAGTSTNSDKGAVRSVNETVSQRTTMSDETREALPKALQKLFQIHRVCSFQLICQGLRDLAVSQATLPKSDARVVVAAGYAVDAPKEELQAVINQVAINIHGVYVLKSSLEHPEYNLFRNVVINLFSAKGPNAKLKKADIMEAAKIALKRDITNNEYTKVLSEICVSRGAAWILKSGDGNPK